MSNEAKAMRISAEAVGQLRRGMEWLRNCNPTPDESVRTLDFLFGVLATGTLLDADAEAPAPEPGQRCAWPGCGVLASATAHVHGMAPFTPAPPGEQWERCAKCGGDAYWYLKSKPGERWCSNENCRAPFPGAPAPEPPASGLSLGIAPDSIYHRPAPAPPPEATEPKAEGEGLSGADPVEAWLKGYFRLGSQLDAEVRRVVRELEAESTRRAEGLRDGTQRESDMATELTRLRTENEALRQRAEAAERALAAEREGGREMGEKALVYDWNLRHREGCKHPARWRRLNEDTTMCEDVRLTCSACGAIIRFNVTALGAYINATEEARNGD